MLKDESKILSVQQFLKFIFNYFFCSTFSVHFSTAQLSEK